MQNEPSLQRIPPHSLDAEQAVLGAVLLRSESINDIQDVLRPEDFYMESHGHIYASFVELAKNAQPIDLITVKDALEKSGKLESVGGVAYLTELVGHVPTASMAGNYARIIHEKSLLRRMIHAGFDIVSEGYEEPGDVDDYIDRSEKKIFDVSQNKTEQPYLPIRDILGESFRRIEELDARTGEVSGVPSGFYALDKITSGFQPGELVIVAARPSMGKTSLALNVASNAALDHGRSVGVFSLEMSRQELVIRMLCSHARVDSQKFRIGRLSDEEWIRLTDATTPLGNAKVFIDDSARLNDTTIRSKSRRMKTIHGLDMIIVDYLQLMHGAGKGRDTNREQEIAQISRSLKGLAKELEIPVIALSQLNRDLEKRQDKRPQMSDLRESGAIEQDADVIAFIYRDIVYNPDNLDKENTAEVIVAKNRSGPTGRVDLRYFREFTRFENFLPDDAMDDYGPPGY